MRLLLLCLQLVEAARVTRQIGTDLPSTLRGLLTPKPPKGVPFPKIPGPKTQDRVCIVGAGPAGIDMALQLKERGFSNVVVFEKSDLVGGKSHDYQFQGANHPLGTSLLQETYFDNLLEVAEKYDLAEKVPFEVRGIWNTNKASIGGSRLSPEQFLGLQLFELTQSFDRDENVAAFVQAAIKYINVHQEMFGSYEGDLMARPSQEVLERIRGSFHDFLEREDLLLVEPILQQVITVPGYGATTEIAALYALMWLNPSQMVSLALTGLGEAEDPYYIYILKEGYAKLWNTIVEKEKLDVRYNVDIASVKRSGLETGVTIGIQNGLEVDQEECDFMVWTPSMIELMKVLHAPTLKEVNLFSTLKADIHSASVVTSKGTIRHAPYTVFMESVNSPVFDHQVLVSFDWDALVNIPDIGTPEGLAKYNNGTDVRTITCLQLGKERISQRALRNKLKDHYEKGFNSSDIEFLTTEVWEYFHRWNPSEVVQERHWDVFDIQGHGGIIYAGSSVVFETVRSVMTYNRLLLRQMDPELRILPQVVKPVRCPRCLDRPKRINNKDCCRCQDEEAFCNNDVAKKSQNSTASALNPGLFAIEDFGIVVRDSSPSLQLGRENICPRGQVICCNPVPGTILESNAELGGLQPEGEDVCKRQDLAAIINFNFGITCGKRDSRAYYEGRLSEAEGGSGEVTNPGEWPWAVLIFSGDKYVGSGVLLDNDMVVTTATKVQGYESDPASLTVRLGDFDPTSTFNDVEDFPHLEVPVDCVKLHPYADYPDSLRFNVAILKLKIRDDPAGPRPDEEISAVSLVDIRTIVRRPGNVPEGVEGFRRNSDKDRKYKGDKLEQRADLLADLNNEVDEFGEFGDPVDTFIPRSYINTACLARAGQFQAGTRCWVAAWGKGLKEQREVNLPLVSNEECQAKLGQEFAKKGLDNWELHHSELCAGGEVGIDTCEGEGGAPLVCLDQARDQFYAVGLVGYGFECGKDIPAVYTNLADPDIKDFIDSAFDNNFC